MNFSLILHQKAYVCNHNLITMSDYITSTFEEFFKKATSFTPYPYQQKLSDSEDIPDILNIPTGAGKTAAAVLGIYLWRILNSDEKIRQDTPRRLVYCLPMRVLVEQTVGKIEEWIKKLGLEDKIKVVIMMGGDVDRHYIMNPEESMIIVGTQDMLLSRALNRGYAASPYQWPRDFGLLNNDCLWIMDEIQLMRNGLATSVQLEAFRNKIGTYGPHKTVWMSATVNPQWLDTIDFDSKKCTHFELSDEDSSNTDLKKRNNAKKKLVEMDLTISKDDYTKNEVALIREKHVEGTLTMIIVNTVKRAQSIFKEIKKSMGDDCMLIHSRFRKKERQKLNKQLEELAKSDQKNMIIVSTQVVEAGVDISAKTMITETAPWPSLVQRFGRCNRKGDYDDSTISIIKLDKKRYNPYEDKDMEEVQEKLAQKYNSSVSPSTIGSQSKEITHESVIREPDIIGLFDTIPDMSGNHTDISMYVRALEMSSDVSVIWRKWNKEESPPKNTISNDEICSVPIGEINDFRKKEKIRLWTFNAQDGNWERISTIYPGQIILINSNDGGYSNEIGWDLKNNESVEEQDSADTSQRDGMNNDPDSYNKKWVTLNDHTVHVIQEVEDIIDKTNYLKELKDIMKCVTEYHDIGKAHHVFQNTMLKNVKDSNITNDTFWAKRGSGSPSHEIDNYRHEAISALAVLNIKPELPELKLVAYLIASHHGKVRLSMRTMPTKRNMEKHDKRYLLGIDMEKGEDVPIFLSDKNEKTKNNKEKILTQNVSEKIHITVDIARIGNTNDGKPSWLKMTLNLLKEYGPFKLALLEAVIRAADTRASEKEGKEKD